MESLESETLTDEIYFKGKYLICYAPQLLKTGAIAMYRITTIEEVKPDITEESK